MSNENYNHPDEKRSLKEEFDESATPDDLDDSKVKFLNGKKQGLDEECVVEVGSDVSFTGLGKEELMKYANDPFWVRTRKILFAIFWIGWLAMLVAAILIIVFAPKCPKRPDLKWYQTDVVYQIQPKSFKDSQKEAGEGAGIGDLEGISSKVEYLEDLGVNAFWINSIYKAGGLYDNNDVEDHKKVDPSVGTMEGFDALRKKTKKKGMRMILDFIPNHTGKKHEWFTKSVARAEGFEHFYIWANGTTPDPTVNPPNGWKSVYNQPAWTYDPTRGQWYYHSTLSAYPDLNLRNDEVLEQLDGILRFWLDKGVDGFAVQGLQYLVEHNDTSLEETDPGTYTVDQPENLDIVKRWRGIINSYSDKPGREKVLVGYVKSNGNNTDDYSKAGIHIILDDTLITCKYDCLKDKLKEVNGDYWRGWMVDSENSERFGSAIDKSLQNAWQAFHFLLKGTAFVYYGDEIAMEDGVVNPSEMKDPLANLTGQTSRDPYRTPMLWTNEENAGFCAKGVTPWLPVNKNYISGNVEFNSAHLVGYTVLSSFKDLVKLRSEESFQFGTLEVDVSNEMLYFKRKAEGFPGFLVAINRGAQTAGFKNVADTLTLRYDSSGNENVGKVFDTRNSPIGFKKDVVYVFQY